MVLRVRDIDAVQLDDLLARYGIQVERVADDAAIPASFWGDDEAGVRGMTVFVRGDTPVHSVLHEAGHVICMDGQRRAALIRDAGGDDIEEAAVCYLQILLAAELPGVGRDRLIRDMDTWGYSFRLGSTADWFRDDADDARDWLIRHRLIDGVQRPLFQLRL